MAHVRLVHGGLEDGVPRRPASVRLQVVQHGPVEQDARVRERKVGGQVRCDARLTKIVEALTGPEGDTRSECDVNAQGAVGTWGHDRVQCTRVCERMRGGAGVGVGD